MNRCKSLLSPALSLVLLFLAGCDSGNVGGPNNEEEVSKVLTRDLAGAVTARDAGAYAALLHPDYRFSFAAGDAPAGLPGAFWGKTTEVSVIDSLLTGTGVSSVRLDIAVLDDAFEPIPGKTNEWDYRALAITGASVVLAGSADPIDTILVTTIETFHLRIDGEGGSWKIYDEREPEALDKTLDPAPGTSRWGEVKALFYEPLGPPAARTVKGTVSLRDGVTLAGATLRAGTQKDTTDAYGRFEIAGVPPAVTVIRVNHPDAFSAVLPVGGGDEVFRLDVTLTPDTTPVDPDRNRTTVVNLITKYLPFVYAEMDSAGYETTLDEAYTFELLESEPDPDFPEGWWDKIEELAIVGNMFGGRANPQGQTVQDITLTLQIKSNVVDNTNYPQKPPGETWYKVTTYVDLRVIADDPGDPSGVMNFLVSSDQIFIVRPDPDADSLWVIYKQIDQPSINKERPAALAGTDSRSWGSVKSLWR